MDPLSIIGHTTIKIARLMRDIFVPVTDPLPVTIWTMEILPYLPLRDLIKMRRLSYGWKDFIERLIQQEQGSDNRFAKPGLYSHEFFNFGYWALTTCGIPNLDERDFSLNSKIDQIIFTLRMPMDIRYNGYLLPNTVGNTYIDITPTDW